MVTRFGSREICNVTFKAIQDNQKLGNRELKKGQLALVIDTATTSSTEQAETTVYAQGGFGNPRLIAWSGEKTMTFRVTDALLSPVSLALLTGAGLAKEEDVKHIHMTYDCPLDSDGKAVVPFERLADELNVPLTRTINGVKESNVIKVCVDPNIQPQGIVLDHNGALVDWIDPGSITFEGQAAIDRANAIDVDSDNPLLVSVSAGSAAGKTVKLDFYVIMTTGATQITIEPDDFGGYYYVEADTLYRNQDGKDMAATLTFPKVKVQSNFTLTMANSGKIIQIAC